MREWRVEVRPRWPVRLPSHGGPVGIVRVRNGVLHRLLHLDDRPVIVRAAQPARDRVVIGAQAEDREAADEAISRMRFALGVDDDLRPFYERFRFDPLIGASVRHRPHLRPRRQPVPFEALLYAICAQLIEAELAAEIVREIAHRHGRSCPRTGLRDLPDAATVARLAPVQIEACGLAAKRSVTMVRAAREVAAGRVDLDDPDHEAGWRRLRAISGIGRWTIETLGLYGQGRLDQLPAGDLEFLKLAGRVLTGRPRAVATEEEVRDLMAPYAPYQGLAIAHLAAAMRSARLRPALPAHRPARVAAAAV